MRCIMKYYGGIDPGFTGGFAVVDDVGNSVVLYDAPTTMVPYTKKGKKRTRQEFDLSGMRDMLTNVPVQCVYLEDVTARAGQGVVSMFRFGHGLGLWEGLLTGLGITFVKVLPTTWKTKLGLLNTEKDDARIWAKQQFPIADLKLKKHQGRADALCLAEYGRRINTEGK
jgi:Holliday junction resolvasome RuvABC endonuclease subunit